jgi:diguanylate cyclase (GGDEF)-like protein
VLVSGSFFARRAVAAHVFWILLSWGLALVATQEAAGYSTITRWLLGSLVLGVSAAVMTEIVAGRKSTEERLRRAQGELEHLAHHDPLTGIANRRLCEAELAREMARANRQDAPLCLVALDLDGFKEYNDHHGHLAGDRLLKLVASSWSRALRASDLIARLGGDEFVVLLPDCPLSEAEQVAERLRSDLPYGSRCSTGIACWNGQDSAEDLLALADEAMYEAKQNGSERPLAQVGSARDPQ